MLLLSKLPAIAIVTAAIGLLNAPCAQAQTHYTLLKTIDLPGTGGHGDWVSFDKQTNAVWIGQAPAHNVIVIDAADLTVKATIPGIKDANGIDLDSTYAFVADAKSNALVVIDKRTFKKVATLDTAGQGPDGVAVDTRADTVFVANDDSNTETVFSGKAPFKRLAVFKLKPEPAKHGPDVNLYVPQLDRVYQPVDNQVDVIDPNSHEIVAVWDFKVKTDTKPMVYDSKTRHLIIGTRDQKMLVVDPASGDLLATIPFAGGNIDQTAIDVGARRAFMGDKSGNIEVIDLDTNQVVDHLSVERDVHTLAVDPTTHRIFVYLNVSNKVAVFEPV